MIRFRFSLLSFFVVLTLCAVCCGAISYIADSEQVTPYHGTGKIWRIGPMAWGTVDRFDDERGRLYGVWWRSQQSWAGGENVRDVPVFVIEWPPGEALNKRLPHPDKSPAPASAPQSAPPGRSKTQ